MYFLGIDLGTTHSKILVTDREGKQISYFKADSPSYHHHPGWHEQHADEIFNNILDLIKKAFRSLPASASSVTICFSGAMHGLMAVDDAGHPLTPVMTWADTRSNEFAKQWKNSPAGREIYRQTGTPVHPMSPLCKIAWIREHHPLVFERAFKYISLKEYILFKLTGTFIIDYSTASATGLFEIQNLHWHMPSLVLAGITKNHLSVPVPCDYICPSMKVEYVEMERTGLKLTLIAGSSDGALANIGAGAIGENELGLTIGTSAAARVFAQHIPADHSGKLFCYVFDQHMYLSGGATNNGGNLLEWFSRNFADGEMSPAAIIVAASKSVPGARGIVFLPYVYGERAPVWDADAIPVFSEAKTTHTVDDRARALLEGICFSLLQIMLSVETAGSPVESVYASGGFTESRFWVQLLADILQKKIQIPAVPDASALGAVFLAMKATGVIQSWDEVKKMIHIDEVINPDTDPAKQALYKSHFEKYQTLYPFIIRLKADYI